jgi:hypothetical protein
MATYTTNLTTFWLETATTVTAIGTGGAGLGNPETDFFIQGTDCISKSAWTNAIKGFIIDALATTFTVPTDGAVIFFAKYDAAGSLAVKASGGLQGIIGSSSSAYDHFYIGGSDTLAFDSWVPYVIDPNTATADTTTGSPSGSERWVGLLANLPTTSGPTKGSPIAMDAIRYGRCDIEYTATGCTFSGAEAWANATSRRWGLLELLNGSYLLQGFHSFGTVSASCTFTDSNKVLFFRASGNNNVTNDAVSTGFNRIEILNASSTITWDNISISALGTRARGVFVHTAGTIDFDNCQFTDMDTFTLIAGSDIQGSTWRRCNAITAPGSTLNNSSVLASSVAADASALVWNVATDPDGKLDGMTFSKGATAHHAIELGASTPASISLRGWTVTGFNTVDGNNDSVILNTSGKAITVNVFDATGTISFKNSGVGSSTTIVSGAVSLNINVKDTAGTNIQSARVLLKASDGTGPFPFEDTVTITRSGTTATVSHTAHGMAVADKVQIKGADQPEYNGVFSITNPSTNAYDYTVSGSPASPATGTIKATFVALHDLTNASGNVTASRVYATDQPVTGVVRKSTSSPYYQTGPLGGTVDSATGYTANVQLVSDE